MTKKSAASICGVALIACASVGASDSLSFTPSPRALEGAVETRVGTLEFVNGYPTDATIDKLYDEMDFQRAVQAYLWGLPMVEMAEWAHAHRNIFGAGHYDFTTYLDFVEKQGILTASELMTKIKRNLCRPAFPACINALDITYITK